MSDDLRRRITRQDAAYIAGACLAVAILFAMGFAFVTLFFLIE